MIIGIVGGIFQDVGVKSVCMKNVLIFDGQDNHPSADLVLRDFQTQNLLVRESQLGQHQHVAIVLLEFPG